MEDEIKVNEYVRTKNGYIIKVDENTTIFNLGYKEQYIDMETTRYGFICEEEIVKHSKQLIDLIEGKDVVKYRIDNISTTLETRGYIEGIVDISDEEMLQKIKSDKNYHILEILTKEQYKANCYKVGGEDE